jgi:hypothetical protein
VSYENFNRRLVPPWDSSRRALPRKTQEKKIVTRHAHYLALLQNRKEVKKEKKNLPLLWLRQIMHMWRSSRKT